MGPGSLQACCSIFGPLVAEPRLSYASSLDQQQSPRAINRVTNVAVAGTAEEA